MPSATDTVKHFSAKQRRKLQEWFGVTAQAVKAMAKKKNVAPFETYFRMAREYNDAAEETKVAAKAKDQAAKQVVRQARTAAAIADGSHAIKRSASARKGAATKAVKDDAIRAINAADLIAHRAAAYNKVVKRMATRNAKVVAEALAANIEEQLSRRRYMLNIELTGMKLERGRTGEYERMHGNSTYMNGIQHRDLLAHGLNSQPFMDAEALVMKSLDDYGMEYFNVYEHGRTYNVSDLGMATDALALIRMKDGRDLVFDGADMTWDTGNGRCFTDWFIATFKHEPKLARYCNAEKLAEIALDPKVVDDDPLKNGFHSRHIQRIAIHTGQTMVAMIGGKNGKHIATHLPKGKDRMHVGAICYEVRGYHFYPFSGSDLDSIAKSIHLKVSSDTIVARISEKSKDDVEGQESAKVARTSKDSANSCRREKVVKEKERAWDEVEIIDGVEDTKEFLFSKMIEFNDVPTTNSIYMKKGKVHTFVINQTKYLVNQDAEFARQLCDNTGREWDGASLHTMIFEELEKEKLVPPRAVMNPSVFASFAAQGIKSRMAYGCRNGYTEEDIRAIDPSRLKQWDITKCHAGALCNPRFPWVFPLFNDDWEPFDESKDDIAVPGFYKVRTKNQFPLSGDNIYPTNALVPARENNVEFTVYEKLVCSGCLTDGFMHKIITLFLKMSKNEMNLFMELYKRFSGWLGRTHSAGTSVNLECNPVIIAHTLLSAPDGAQPISERIGEHNGKGWFVFGTKSPVKEMAEHTLPFYIQMLSNANANFYDMVKAMEGTALYFKVDYALVLDGVAPPALGGLGSYHEVPMYKTSEETGELVLNLHKKMPPNKRDTNPFDVQFEPRRVFDDAPFDDSSDWRLVAPLLLENGGLLLMGEAGTGKTTMASKAVELLEAAGHPVVRLAPTHKAANQIFGRTVHSFLQLNGDGGMVEKRLREIVRDASAADKPTIIWFNEISMASRHMWQKFCIIKKLCTRLIFLVEGDYRQCSPVKDSF